MFSLVATTLPPFTLAYQLATLYIPLMDYIGQPRFSYSMHRTVAGQIITYIYEKHGFHHILLLTIVTIQI